MGRPLIGSPATAAIDKPRVLPEIRQDLQLIEAPADFDGSRRWLIYDPVQHRFVSLGGSGHALLQLWRPGLQVQQLIDLAWTRFALLVGPEDVERFEGFLHDNNLTLSGRAGSRGFHQAAEHRRRSAVMGLVHSYVFTRVPLFRPDRFLAETLPWVRPLGLPFTAAAIVILGVIGLYLVSREWDAFCATFIDIFTVQGLLLMAASLVVVKIFHELGHAYAAKHFGCRVPVIGVAFILAIPLLYADVTDAWRLKSRRQRLWVDSAGILVDLAVACIATFAWAFLPAGGAKSIAFSLATAGWVLSLAMNLNPFMKFDGYHIAADLTGMENLHKRAIAMARWTLREVLFDLRHAPPETMSPAAMRAMALFGCGVMIYRLILFTAIALAVYAVFFKVAGVILFIVEIVYFVVAPVWKEVREWIAMRTEILARRRTAWTAAIILSGLVVLVLPWSATVRLPAVVEAHDLQPIFSAIPSNVGQVHAAAGQPVAAGDRLVTLSAPMLQHELTLTQLRIELLRIRQSRRASDDADREAAVVLDQEHASLTEQRDGLMRRIGELDIRSPIDGRLAEVDEHLQEGRWVTSDKPLMLIRSDKNVHVRGLVGEVDVWRLQVGATGRFIPDDVMLPSLPVTLKSVAAGSVPVVDQIELVANFGGRVPAQLDAHRQPVPTTAQYGIRAVLQQDVPPQMLLTTIPGVVVIEGRRESILAGLWRQALKVVVRESGI